jgi:hypothetical protein
VVIEESNLYCKLIQIGHFKMKKCVFLTYNVCGEWGASPPTTPSDPCHGNIWLQATLVLRIFLEFYWTWLYIWVTWRVSYKKQDGGTYLPFVSTGVHSLVFFMGSVLLIVLVFCVVLLCVFTFWVLYCDVGYDFHIKTMLGSSLPPVVLGELMSYLRYLCLFA